MTTVSMTDRKRRDARAWGRLPNSVLKSSQLSVTAKVVAAYRCTFSPGWKTVASHAASAFSPPLGKGKTRGAIAELRAAGFFGAGQEAWANRSPNKKGNPARFKPAAEELSRPTSDYTFVRRSWFDGTLSCEETAALLCVAARLSGPSVYLSDIASFLGCSLATAGIRMKALCERGLAEFVQRASDGRYCERDFKLVTTSANIFEEFAEDKTQPMPIDPLAKHFQCRMSEDFAATYNQELIERFARDAVSLSGSDRMAIAEPQVGDMVLWSRNGGDRLARVANVYHYSAGVMLSVVGCAGLVPGHEVIVLQQSDEVDEADAAELWDKRLLGWIDPSSDTLDGVEENVKAMLEYDQEWFRTALINASGGRIGGRLINRVGLEAFFWLAAHIYERSVSDHFAPACCMLLNAVYDRVGSRPDQRLNSWGLIGERLLKYTYGDDFIDLGARIFVADHAPMFVLSDDEQTIHYNHSG